MVFKELSIGEKFQFDGNEYIKMADKRSGGCKCRVTSNAIKVSDNKEALIHKNAVVTKLE